jgi:hypothetical protein
MPGGAQSVYSAAPYGGDGAPQAGAGRRRGASVKTLKRALKKAGLKVSGKKATLTRRAKKAHLKLRGGADGDACDLPGEATGSMGGVKQGDACVPPPAEMGGRRRRSRKNGLVRGVYSGVTGVAKGTLRRFGSVGRAVFGRGKPAGGDEDDV